MIHEANKIEWKIGDIVIADCDSKTHKMLMVVIGEKMEHGVRILETKYLNPMEIIPNCVLSLPGNQKKRFLAKYYNVWLNEIKYLHDPARFDIVIADSDLEKVKKDHLLKGE